MSGHSRRRPANKTPSLTHLLDRVPSVTDAVLMGLFVLLFLLAAFSDGFAGHGLWRAGGWAVCALLGIGALAVWARGLWRLGRAPAIRWIIVTFGFVLLISGAQLLPLPRSVVVGFSPAWAKTIEHYQLSGIPLPEKLPFATSPLRAAQGWSQLLACLCVFLAAAALARRRRGARFLMALVGAASIAEGCFAILSLLTASQSRGHGFIFNPNHSAALILMGLPLGLYWLVHRSNELTMRARSRQPLVLPLCIYLIAVLGWLLTLSRGSLLVGVLMLPAWALLRLVLTRGGGKLLARVTRPAVLQAVAFAAIGLILGFLALGAEAMAERSLPGDSDSIARLAYWKAAWTGFQESNYLGLGLGGTEFAMQRFIDGTALRRTPIWAHNDWLQWLCDLGLPGALGTVLLTSLGVWALTRPGTGSDPFGFGEDRIDRQLCWVGVASILAHSAVDFPLRIPIVGFAFWILVAIVCSPETGSQRPRGGRRRPSKRRERSSPSADGDGSHPR